MKGCINQLKYNVQYGDEVCLGPRGRGHNDECKCRHAVSLIVQMDNVEYVRTQCNERKHRICMCKT
jgi:hypothetical protein